MALVNQVDKSLSGTREAANKCAPTTRNDCVTLSGAHFYYRSASWPVYLPTLYIFTTNIILYKYIRLKGLNHLFSNLKNIIS